MNALGDCVYQMRNASKENTFLKLSSQEYDNTNTAITYLLDENNKQDEIDAVEDHLKELESMFELIK